MKVFFILSKILAPFCSLVGLFILSFWLLLFFHARLSRRVWFLWGFFFYLTSLPITADILLSLWEIDLGKPEQLDQGIYDVMVILGGMVEGVSSEGQWLLGSSVDRLTEASRLYKNGRAQYLLVTGGTTGVFTKSAWHESKVMLEFLTVLGIPPEVILVEDQALNTYENALYSIPILKSVNLETVLLITSAFHMRRALAVFEKLGITSVSYAVDSRKMDIDFPLNFLPSQTAFGLVDLVIKEMLGLIAYRLVGYV